MVGDTSRSDDDDGWILENDEHDDRPALSLVRIRRMRTRELSL